MRGLMIDSHTHLASLADAEEAIAEAGRAGVCGMVTIGTTPEVVAESIAIAERHDESVRVGAGVHPHEALRLLGGAEPDDRSWWDELRVLAASPHVCAIGETGFDQFRDHGPIELQHELFELHVDLARERALPLVIHTRAAEQVTLDALADLADGLVVVMHCFSMPDRVEEVVERGYMVSFAGNVTYPSAEELRRAATLVPADQLLVETDAPYLTPVPHRGERNAPAHVVHTAACVAAARGDDVDDLKAQLVDNATRVFGFSGVRIM